jgi:hypothetical protein
MKKYTVGYLCVLAGLALILGCEGSGVRKGQGLPDEVTGVWKARGNPWKIELSRSGTVKSALVPLGNVEIRPNKTTKVEMADGGTSIYKAGDCSVEYDPAGRQLRVVVRLDEVKIAFMDQRIEGHTEDAFLGTVSEDGSVWETSWLSFFDLGERFPMDPNSVGEVLVFDKVKGQ